MQLLNKSPVEDIVNNLVIDDNFCISYGKNIIEVPKDILSNIKKLPKDIQDKYLCLRLRNFLYELFFKGEIDKDIASEAKENLVNNTVKGINFDFYKQLDINNCGSGYFDAGWLIVKKNKKGSLAVRKNDLILQIKPSHLENKTYKIGDVVAVRFPHNRVEIGFYVAIGNAGNVDKKEVVEIYFNVSAEGAIALMKKITEQLNKIGIPFSFKVLSQTEEYWRYDSGILYIEARHYREIQPILQQVYQENKRYFANNIPLFTKLIAPGVGLAESNQDKNFGLNRLHLVADALYAAWKKGSNSGQERMYLIKQNFLSSRLRWEFPYLNPDSEDIYTPLEV